MFRIILNPKRLMRSARLKLNSMLEIQVFKNLDNPYMPVVLAKKVDNTENITRRPVQVFCLNCRDEDNKPRYLGTVLEGDDIVCINCQRVYRAIVPPNNK